MAIVVAAACSHDPVQIREPRASLAGPSMSLAGPLTVRDVAVEANFQDDAFGHHKRGRACLAADLDNDGWTDVVIGNPGDESHVLLNTTGRTGVLSFEQGPVLAADAVFWGGTLGDLDNDGDVDVVMSGGGNETRAADEVFVNRFVEEGVLRFDRGARQAGIEGPAPEGDVLAWSSASAHVLDLDLDGKLDLFVNSYILPRAPDVDWSGENLIWRNLGRGDFEEVGGPAGLTTARSTMNSSFIDIDNDGDFDLYESNHRYNNVMWRNMWMEEGELRFQNITPDDALAGGTMKYPRRSFASAVSDFNRDGFEDLFVFIRPVEPEDSPFRDGHVLFLNLEGQGFVEVSAHTGLNQPFINWRRDHAIDGVMGGQLGDVNVDGIPDVWIGQGRPLDGTSNLLFLSTGELRVVDIDGHTVAVPQFENASSFIDVPAPEPEDTTIAFAPYPYRTHGTCIVDFDRDGVPEVAVTNGGPEDYPDVVREPNRLFDFTFEEPRTWLSVALQGDGEAVNRSAIGTKVVLTVQRDGDGAEWQHTQWLHGGSGFSAVNDLELFFGLANADRITELAIHWPDGRIDVEGEVPVNQRVIRGYQLR
ncbi:MAG: CRTAC1 family protein [Myxococcales bacterium]|nr:CRTAC1 family protein [Myxococcales bacterium]